MMKAVNNQPLTPLLFLQRSKEVYRDKVAVTDKNGHITYSEFYEKCLALAKALKKIGIQSGDSVAYLSRNNSQMLEAYYAVPMLGAILVPINTRLSPGEINYILKHSEAKLLVGEEQFIDDSFLETIDKIVMMSEIQNGVKKNNYHAYFDFISAGEQEIDFTSHECTDENAVITINYTSGTTGTPKGVMYSHRSVYLNSLGECLTVKLTQDSRYLWVLPMFHCNGWCFVWAVTAIGATHVCMDSFDPYTTIQSIQDNDITHFCAAPAVLAMLTQAENFCALKEKKILTIITAGSSPSPKLIQLYEELGVSIIHVYGLTETHGPHLICEKQLHWNNLSTTDLIKLKSFQGVSNIHGIFTKVVNKNYEDVPHDGLTVGEIIMKGNNIMLGYYKDSSATQHAFRNGWFHSGDLAVINPNGYIEVKDRSKDIIISGGENISSIEVENVIYQLSEVLTVAVIPMKDKKWGEVPLAIIELKNGHSLSEEKVILHCRLNLAHFKCPKIVSFTQIPKTSTGKVQKHLLREKFSTLSPHFLNDNTETGETK